MLSGGYACSSRKYSSTSLNHECARGPSMSATGRSFAIVNSTGRYRANPRSVARYGDFAATNGLTSIFAVNRAPPIQASSAGAVVVSGGVRKKIAAYTPMMYRFPVGPPPPLHENGAYTSSAIADPTTDKKISNRHGCVRSRDSSHRPIATIPGKKYGTNPKCRPTRKYSTLCAKRGAKFWSTLSESESFVLISVPLRSHTLSFDPSNGKAV